MPNDKTSGTVDDIGIARPAPTEHVMQFFEYAHLPPKLADISRRFAELAQEIVDPVCGLPRNQQRTISLNNLLASKDAAIRAAIAKDV